MIQDIGSSRLEISYKNCDPGQTDTVLSFNEKGEVLAAIEGVRLAFPTSERVDSRDGTAFIFSVDEKPYFLILSGESKAAPGFDYINLRSIRGAVPNIDLFIVYTAYHLWRWYMDNRICGRCGNRLFKKTDERALICEKCNNIVYPRINPAVIVGVINGDRILITRYRTGYAHNALVAGFTEIGETLEQTVAREVMEETGVRVKNIRYYKSQPWGIAQDILTGFFCELDGDDSIRMDENELKYAQWVTRKELELQPNDISLTNEMMKVFKSGKNIF